MAKKGKSKKNLSRKQAEKKRQKKRKIVFFVLVALILVFIFIGTGAYLRVSYLLKEEIIMQSDPSYSMVELRRGESESLRVTTDIWSTWACRAECTEELVSIGNGSAVFQDTYLVDNHKSIFFEKNISVERKGRGQELYSYSVTCTSIPSTFCPGENPPRRRESIISVNYDVSEEESVSEQQLKDILNRAIEELHFSKIVLSWNNEALSQASTILMVDDLHEKTRRAETDIELLERTASVIIGFWESYEFSEGKNLAVSSALQEETVKVRESLEGIKNETMMRSDYHYALTGMLIAARNKEVLLTRMKQTTKNNDTMSAIDSFTQEVNRAILKLNNRSLTGYEDAIRIIEDKNTILEHAKQIYLNETMQRHYEEEYLNLAEALLCVSGESGNGCRMEAPSIASNASLSDSVDRNIKRCEAADNITRIILKREEDSERRRSAAGNTSTEEADVEQLKISLSMVKRAGITNSILREELESALRRKNVNPASITSSYYPESHNEGLIEYFKPAPSIIKEKIGVLADECEEGFSRNISVEDIRVIRNVELPETPVFSEPTRLEKASPVCCAYNECNACCDADNCEKNPPLILLHGHSIMERYSPEYSTDAFNEMLERLVVEKEYLPGGLITPRSRLDEELRGDLGRNTLPIAFKATYYYTTYFEGPGYVTSISKTENIDTYAIRLKEMIDWAKHVTGEEKVDVLAHSMGGLVARRYIQIFGEESIGRLIMIGTPNQGITGRVAGMCGFLSDNKECRDMREESTFMKTINDPNNQPEKTSIYLIKGEGCDMEGRNGDGIVLSERANLEYAETHVIQGTCEGFTRTLHSDLLKPRIHPEAYNIIKEILMER